MADSAQMLNGRSAPWAALGVSFVVHLTAIGIVDTIAFPSNKPQAGQTFAVTIDGVVHEDTADSVELRLDQWMPDAGGGGGGGVSNPAGESDRTDLTVNPDSLIEGRVEIGGGEVSDWVGNLGDSGSGGGRGGGTGTGNGDGIGDGDGFFGLELTGERIVFVVDASQSMNAPYPGESRNRLGRVKFEIYHAVRRMTVDQKFFVVFFNTDPIPMPAHDLIPAEPELVRPFMEWIFKFRAHGKTNPETALLLALKLRPDKVYFLTDGDFSYRSVRSVREANLARIPIHTVGFGGREGEMNLMEIVKDSRGTYQFIETPTLPDEPSTRTPTAAKGVAIDKPR